MPEVRDQPPPRVLAFAESSVARKRKEKKEKTSEGRLLDVHVAHDPFAVAKNDLSKRLSEAVRVARPGSKIPGCLKNNQEP